MLASVIANVADVWISVINELWRSLNENYEIVKIQITKENVNLIYITRSIARHGPHTTAKNSAENLGEKKAERDEQQNLPVLGNRDRFTKFK